MTRRAMPNADAAWLHMDRPTNRMVINAVLWFDEPLDAERLREVLRERLVEPFPSFRRLAVERGALGGADWVDDDAFDLDRHLHRLGLPAPGDRAALQELVGDLASTPLDRDKPLWDAYVIDGYGTGSALLLRMHHCIADGIVLARVMLSLADGAAPLADGASPGAESPPEPGRRRGTLLPGPLAPLARTARSVSSALAHEGVELLVHPQRVAEALAADAQAAAKLLLSPSDPATAIHGGLSPVARVAWSKPFPLDAVKTLAHAHGATVNDVLVAAVAGALRRHLGEPDPLAGEVHAMVPFNLRPLDEPLPAELGNRFGLVLLGLPTWIDDPLERLHAVHARMAQIKSSREGAVAYGLLAAMGVTPPAVENRLIDFFSAKASLVLTNVPGPREPVGVAGARIAGVLVWAPCAGDIAMSVSIFSYAGDVSVGFLVDAGLVPDPEALVEHLQGELAALAGS